MSIRTAVLGYGLAGKVFHCPFVHAVPGLDLTIIVQRTGEPARDRSPDAKLVRTVEEAFSAPDIDLIVVGLPSDTHFEMARRALEAGKHVVVDKPFAASSREARQLIDLAKAKGKILAPFHNRRWDCDFLTVRKILDEGSLGRVVEVFSSYDRFRPIQRPNTWKEAASPTTGILFDLGPHLVDQPLALFGPPTSVTASVREDRDQTNINDAIDITLAYHSTPQWPGRSLRYICHATMLCAEPAPRFRVHGTHGSYVKNGLDPQENALLNLNAVPPPVGDPAPWLPEPESAWGTLTLATERREPVQVERNVYPSVTGDYRNFYLSVRDAIAAGKPLAVPSEDGFRTIRLLELAQQSSTEGRTIPIDFA
jgi:scyllo-inositol 2-dehydrogenase (NADP+)